jgi:hypothetical protein
MKPYVNYVPVRSDMSDLTEQLQWVAAHPKEIKQIGDFFTYFTSSSSFSFS